MAHNGRRSADERLAAELAAGKSVREAAASASVSERTAFRRLEDAAFQARVRELRSAMMFAALGKLSDGLSAAASALVDLVESKNADTKFKASKAVIELCLRVREQVDIEERLTVVERVLKGEGDDGDQGAAEAN